MTAIIVEEPAAARVEHDIALHQIAAARRIEIDTPPKRRCRIGPDVVENVVANHAAG